MNLLQFKTFLTMKKLFKTCISVAAIGGIAFFAACKKEATSTLETVPADLKTAANLTYVAEYENYQVPVAQVKTKIRDVQTKLNHYALESRSAEMVPIAEAVWDIEALANAAEGHASWKYKELNITKHYIPLLTIMQNGQKQVTFSEIGSKYAAAVQFIQQDEARLNYSQANKEAIYANVSPMTASDGDVFLEIEIGIGTDPTCPGCAPMHIPSCEETTNCWRAGGKQGTCNNPVSGPRSGIDATDIIQGFINDVAGGVCPIRQRLNDVFVNDPLNGYFTNILPSGWIYPNRYMNPNDNVQGDGYRDNLLFRTFQGGAATYNDCLSISDVNFYFNGAVTIIKNEFAVRALTGKHLVSADIETDVLLGGGGTNLLHRLQFYYGTFVR
jgi:hypothetical protein